MIHGDGALDLIIHGNDISPHMGSGVSVSESRRGWLIHTTIPRNEVTAGILQPLNEKRISVRFRMTPKTRNGEPIKFPWRTGTGFLSWRKLKTEDEELILCGIGPLSQREPTSKSASGPIAGTVERAVSVGGRIVQSEQTEATITVVAQTKEEIAARIAFLEDKEAAEVRAITSPSFVLFLANSVRAAYRLLYDAGMANQSGKWLYASMILLPLAIEYDMKYLLYKAVGRFKDEYKTHKLLRLFDCLPEGIQGEIVGEFKNELENIGWQRDSPDLRVFLMQTQVVFNVLRYPFDPENATSRHLLEPDITAVLTCVSTALERVSRRT